VLNLPNTLTLSRIFIVPLLVVAACPLAVPACDDGTAAPAGSVTVGTRTDRAVASPTTAGESAASTGSTDSVAEHEPASSDAERTTTTSAAASRLGDALADLFDGQRADAPPSDVVVDDTGRLRVEVPEQWSDRRTSPLTEGAEVPALTAAADQTKFLDGYGAPGLTAVVVGATPADALNAYTFADCDDGGRTPLRAPRLTGLYGVWRDCGETATSIVTVAVRPQGNDETVLLLAQVLTPSDLAALDRALATLQLRPA